MREALYLVQFGDVSEPGYANGGVVVLETTRIFGGDSGYFYLGTYTIKDGEIRAKAVVTKHNPAWSNAFGDYAGAFRIEVVGQIQGQDIVGMMTRLDNGITLPIKLIWTAPLP